LFDHGPIETNNGDRFSDVAAVAGSLIVAMGSAATVHRVCVTTWYALSLSQCVRPLGVRGGD
jgi:hypothetical protein